MTILATSLSANVDSHAVFYRHILLYHSPYFHFIMQLYMQNLHVYIKNLGLK